MVAASGANILPSIPWSVKSGTRMMAMMSTEKATGRATSTSASATIAPLVLRRRPVREVAADVLDDDDGGVDDHADGEREAAEAHEVRGEPGRSP